MRTSPAIPAAPALSQGLSILEFIDASPDAKSFTEIMTALSLTRGTTARLLGVMRERGYLRKNAKGHYELGAAAKRLGVANSQKETLRLASGPVLEVLMNESGCTAILFWWTGRATECIAKRVHEAALGMQDVGAVRDDLLTYPWGWFLMQTLSPAQRDALWSERPGRPDRLTPERVEAHLAHLEAAGVIVDMMLPQLRRITAPIRDRENAIVGALAIGGTDWNLSDDIVDVCSDEVRCAAEQLSAALGWTRTVANPSPLSVS